MNEFLVFASTLFVLISPLPWLLFRPTWRNRGRPGAIGLLVIIPCVSLYTLSFGIRAVTTTQWIWYVSANLVLLAIAGVTVGWVLTTTEYTNFVERPKRALAVLSGFVIIDQVFVWTNPLHHFYYDPIETISLPAGGVAPFGAIVFQIHAVGTYVLVFAGIVVCLVDMITSRGIRRKQNLALLGAVIPPASANLIWQFGLTPSNLTPLAFVLSVFILAWTLFEADFLDVVPRGRERAVRNIDDPIVIIDDDGRVVETNPAARALVDGTEDWYGVQAADFFAPFDEEFERFRSVASVDTEVSIETNESTKYFELNISPLTEGEGNTGGRLVFLRNVTAVKERERKLQKLQKTTEQILQEEDREGICETAIEAATDLSGVEQASAHLYNRREEELVPVATSEAFERVFDVDHPFDQGPNSLLWDVYESDDVVKVSDQTELKQLFCADVPPVESVLLIPLGAHGILLLPAVVTESFNEEHRYFGRLLSATVETALDRARRERELKTVQEVVRDAMTATTHQEMAQAVLNRAPETLDFPLSAIWEYDPTARELQPVARTGPAEPIFDEVPVFGPGNSIAWQAFEEGQTKLVRRTADHPDTYNPDSPIQSEVISPISGFGVFVAGSTQEESFAEHERQILETLTTNLQTASRLIERRRDLRLLDQVLGRILRHNLRNKLTVIKGYALQMQGSVCEENEEYLQHIIDSCEGLEKTANNAKVMRKIIKNREETTSISLREVVEKVVSDAREKFPTAEINSHIDAEVTVTANSDLTVAVEQLVANAVEHNTESETPSVDVRVLETDDGPVVEVADNGPGIPQHERDVLGKHGESALEHGSGAGLWIIDRVAAYSNASLEFTVDDGTIARLVFPSEAQVLGDRDHVSVKKT